MKYDNLFTPGVWTHVCAITYSQSSAVIYINGVNRGGYIMGTMVTGLISGNSIGSFNGLVDEVRLYPRALTQAEVTAVYGYSGSMTTAVMPVLCPTGTFSSAPNATACTQCISGYGAAAGSSSCFILACNAGSFLGNGSTTCATCAAGTFSLANATTCLQCGAGSYCMSGNITACPSPSTSLIGSFIDMHSITQSIDMLLVRY